MLCPWPPSEEVQLVWEKGLRPGQPLDREEEGLTSSPWGQVRREGGESEWNCKSGRRGGGTDRHA